MFRFDFDRCLQAAAFLLRREPSRRMNYMRLINLVYLAERDCIKETGKPLTGARAVAMPRGPVLEQLLDLIRGSHIKTPVWAEHVRKDRYHLELIKDPGVGKLSKYVTSKLEEIASIHEEHDEWDLVEITHQLPEWKRNDPGETSTQIPLLHILEAVGRGDDYDAIVDSTERDFKRSQFFSDVP